MWRLANKRNSTHHIQWKEYLETVYLRQRTNQEHPFSLLLFNDYIRDGQNKKKKNDKKKMVMIFDIWKGGYNGIIIPRWHSTLKNQKPRRTFWKFPQHCKKQNQ